MNNTNLVDEKDRIRFYKFRCLDTDFMYEVTGTTSTHKLEEKFYLDKAIKSLDTIRREDGVNKVLTRTQLKERFTNVEEIEDKFMFRV